MTYYFEALPNTDFKTPFPVTDVEVKLIKYYEGALIPVEFGDNAVYYRCAPSKDKVGHNICLVSLGSASTKVVLFPTHDERFPLGTLLGPKNELKLFLEQRLN